ncbi:DUF4166 domain-containing protein [Methylorubrum podarium]|uniref:DUF4166 domain-containing protein n=1 Tax=Methylorubrum podarium TaxID=200476 RepID=A0ABV1QV05_9HYPH
MRNAAEMAVPVSTPDRPAELFDLRFRALVPDADWARLPPAVRRRFTKRLGVGESAVYAGRVVETDLTALGWLLAQGLRLVGAPLPTSRVADVPSVVAVTQDGAGHGQIWTRLYARGTGFPQAIHSAKRFQGPTGLEERVGAGLGMSLRVLVEDRALVFRSERYFIDLPGVRLILPRWLTPGTLTVSHAATGLRSFRFVLEIRHAWLGRLLRQEVEFSDHVEAREEDASAALP